MGLGGNLDGHSGILVLPIVLGISGRTRRRVSQTDGQRLSLSDVNLGWVIWNREDWHAHRGIRSVSKNDEETKD